MLTSRDLMSWSLLVAVPLVAWLIWRRRPSKIRALAMATLAVYSAILAGLVFGGIPVDGELLELLQGESDPVSIWVPFKATIAVFRWDPGLGLLLVGGNLLLMTPLGYLLPHVSARFEHWKPVLLAAFAVSVTVEATQLGLSHLLGYDYRVFEIDDIVFNTVGAWLGWRLWTLLHGGSSQ